MKFATIIAIVACTIAATFLVGTSANNVTFGVIGSYSRVLDSKYVRVKHSLWRVVDEYVTFPFNGRPNYVNIQAVKVIDYKKKDGGVAYLTEGGPGHRNATIRLKSDRNHGLDYTIIVYG